MKEYKGTLFLLRGIPGSGKTSAGKILSSLMMKEAPVLAADDWFYDQHGNYEWSANEMNRAHADCQYRTEVFMVKGAAAIFVTNTFTTEKEIKPYIKLAQKHNYRLVSMIVENRHGSKSIHNVPEATMQKMHDRFSIKLR